ncbi:glycosyl transferase [Chelatococcus reniformis]|uniref:Glycosyl transferase n=1 Tax=Chelatococcus reniformis TaxID=1494448 RepID=A0A916UNB3_9HYPH|nr:glycosyl transferase [Chelatococcus reniformis]GGC79596.1 glycosyl transferase [Chelatococcus reniformis]
MNVGAAAAAILIAAITCLVLVRLLRPLLVRYALARPNARSGHRVPTPQGGGIAVLAAVIAGTAGPLLAGALPGAGGPLLVLAVAATGIALLGAVDDIRPLPVIPRLAGQAIAVVLALTAGGAELRLLPEVPLAVERGLELFAGLWFVNLTNFMDGLDLMTAAETVPLAAALAGLALAGWLPPAAGVVAGALLGALLGFVPHNWPVARLFLGDVGSLAIGLVLAWLLYRLAAAGAITAAVLLPMYYCLDASITLLRRLRRGERIWQAHRDHFYQQAADRGMPGLTIVGWVVALNLVLVALAVLSLIYDGVAAQIALVLAGAVLAGLVLARFAGRV